MVGGTYPRTRKKNRTIGIQQILGSAEIRIAGKNQSARFLRHAADPAHIREIKAHALAAQELAVNKSGRKGSDGKPVRPRGINRVGSDDMSRARHIAHNDARLRQIFGKVPRQEPGIGVIPPARPHRDDVGDGFASEEIRIGGLCRSTKRPAQYRSGDRKSGA